MEEQMNDHENALLCVLGLCPTLQILGMQKIVHFILD